MLVVVLNCRPAVGQDAPIPGVPVSEQTNRRCELRRWADRRRRAGKFAVSVALASALVGIYLRRGRRGPAEETRGVPAVVLGAGVGMFVWAIARVFDHRRNREADELLKSLTVQPTLGGVVVGASLNW